MSAWWVKCDTVALQSDYHAGDMLADPGSEHSCRENVSECWIGCTASVLLFAWRLRRFLSERNVSFQCTPVIRYSAGDSTEAAAGTVCLCVITCASQCCSRFHLWFAPTPALSLSLSLSLSLNVSLSPLCLFCLSRSKMVCQVKGHLFVVLIMNEQFPLRGRMVCTLRLQQVCGCIFVYVCVCVCVWERERVCVVCKVTNATSQE